jgi:hypothetical protein
MTKTMKPLDFEASIYRLTINDKIALRHVLTDAAIALQLETATPKQIFSDKIQALRCKPNSRRLKRVYMHLKAEKKESVLLFIEYFLASMSARRGRTVVMSS